MKRVLTVLAAVLVAGGLAWAFIPEVRETMAPAAPPAPLATAPPLTGIAPALPSLNPVLARVSSAVVNIAVEGRAQGPMNPFMEDPMFRRFFGDPREMPERRANSVGSGVIVDAENGYIVTNHHVIANADRIDVTLTDRRELRATLVGSDPEIDIAVLKVDARDLTAMPVGKSDSLKIGDFVIAMGNPFGLGQTATLGIVSALGRTGLGIEGYENFIQTDASINPGNSGGALIDQSGNLVGINTAILSRTGGNIGIGFAIPAEMAMLAASQIIDYGGVQRGQMGVTIQDLTPELAEAMGIDAPRGALVSGVMPASPAEKAGLRPGDVVTAVDGKAIGSSSELRNTIGLMRPGQSIAVDIVREGETRTLEMALQDQQKSAQAVPLVGERFAGLALGPLPESHPLAGEVEGVFVQSVAPGSNAARAGVMAGDVIVSINRQPVSGPDDLAQAAASAQGRPLLLHIRRGAGSLFVAMR
jgi:Do/DeqQ family serine protease